MPLLPAIRATRVAATALLAILGALPFPHRAAAQGHAAASALGAPDGREAAPAREGREWRGAGA